MKKPLIGFVGIFLLLFALAAGADWLIQYPERTVYDLRGRILREPTGTDRNYFRYEYGEDGQLVRKKEYAALFLLEHVYYYEDGVLTYSERLSTSSERRGEVTGILTYDEAGRLLRDENYKDGKPTGTYFGYTYHENGELKEEVFYQKGVLERLRQYDEQGRIVLLETDGKEIQRYTYDNEKSWYYVDHYRIAWKKGEVKDELVELLEKSETFVAQSQRTRERLYDEGRIYRENYYQAYGDGHLVKYAVFTYDSQGDLEAETFYTPTGELIEVISHTGKAA